MKYSFRARRWRMLTTVVLALVAGLLGMTPATAIPAIDHTPAAKARSACPSAAPTGLPACTVEIFTPEGRYVFRNGATQRTRNTRATASIKCIDSTTLSGGTYRMSFLYKKIGRTGWSVVQGAERQIPDGRSEVTHTITKDWGRNEAREFFKAAITFDVTCSNGTRLIHEATSKISGELTFYP